MTAPSCCVGAIWEGLRRHYLSCSIIPADRITTGTALAKRRSFKRWSASDAGVAAAGRASKASGSAFESLRDHAHARASRVDRTSDRVLHGADLPAKGTLDPGR